MKKLMVDGASMIVVLHNIRSTYNVGAILRTCDGFGVGEVIFSGHTPHSEKGLPHEREKLLRQIHKTALGAELTVKQRYVEDVMVELERLRGEGFAILALEQAEGSERLDEVVVGNRKMVLVLGEEVSGVSLEILAKVDKVLEIPMRGKKESFNVSVAAGIALWQLGVASGGVGRDGKEECQDKPR